MSMYGVREDKMVGEEEAEGCCEIEKLVSKSSACSYGEAEGNGMPWLGGPPPRPKGRDFPLHVKLACNKSHVAASRCI